MGKSDKQRKKRRPVSRGFWNVLNYLPRSIRESFIRGQFDIDNNLPDGLVLKQAETEDEIFQALSLVYKSYVELDYIDKNETALRFNKYLAHPNTVILIAKLDEEVLGTISIISDSAMGLPSEATWPVNKFRKDGKVIAEISSLAIKKDYKLRRGKLLFPLCKILYLYSVEILKLDGIVISTTLEVEPFYTDILLFEKIVTKTGQKNPFAKGNPSTCCYLDFTNAFKNYENVYGKKKISKNLFKYFCLDNDPHFVLPEKKLSIQSYTVSKNAAQRKLLEKHPSLVKEFSETEIAIINSNKPYITLHNTDANVTQLRKKRSPRLEVRCEGWLFPNEASQPLKCKVMDISRTGLRILFPSKDAHLKLGSKVSLVAHTGNDSVFFKIEIKWANDSSSVGANIIEASPNFGDLIALIENEALTEPPEASLVGTKKIA